MLRFATSCAFPIYATWILGGSQQHPVFIWISFKWKKIVIKYIFSCVHYNSVASNDKHIVKAQLFFMLCRFPMKPSRFV